MDNFFEKYTIVHGELKDDVVINEKPAGTAVFHKNKKSYTLKFNILPRVFFVMVPHESNEYYTIYSRYNRHEGGHGFYSNPIGEAELIEGNKTHMAIYLDAFPQPFFMSLFPMEEKYAGVQN